MKVSISKKQVIRLEPEGTFDSYRLGLLLGRWDQVDRGSSVLNFGFSSNSAKPNAELDYVEFPFGVFLDFIFCFILEG